MKDRNDFSKGKLGRVLPPEPEPAGKTRITIRSTRILWIASLEWRRKPVVGPGIKPLSMGRSRSISTERYRDSRRRATKHHSRGIEIERCLNGNLVHRKQLALREQKPG
jgi:hypothetical protein